MEQDFVVVLKTVCNLNNMFEITIQAMDEQDACTKALRYFHDCIIVDCAPYYIEEEDYLIW